ncbi:hypothetical protein L1887_38816 [Cichorium endivia]|nr:hypothetical protein L1887_38816 [Cichorium endivia]
MNESLSQTIKRSSSSWPCSNQLKSGFTLRSLHHAFFAPLFFLSYTYDFPCFDDAYLNGEGIAILKLILCISGFKEILKIHRIKYEESKMGLYFLGFLNTVPFQFLNTVPVGFQRIVNFMIQFWSLISLVLSDIDIQETRVSFLGCILIGKAWESYHDVKLDDRSLICLANIFIVASESFASLIEGTPSINQKTPKGLFSL